MSFITALISHQSYYDIFRTQFAGVDSYITLLSAQDIDITSTELLDSIEDSRLILVDNVSWEHHRNATEALIKNCLLKPFVLCIGQTPDKNSCDASVNVPFKWGRLLDDIDRYTAISSENIQTDKIDCRPYGYIDTRKMQWVGSNDGNKGNVALTDKEVILLHALSLTQSGPVSKKTLYKAVWGYKDDLETHTLETHIYRLRQKIEPNPQTPAIIQTCDESYGLINH